MKRSGLNQRQAFYGVRRQSGAATALWMVLRA
jgi:hypothetical protein